MQFFTPNLLKELPWETRWKLCIIEQNKIEENKSLTREMAMENGVWFAIQKYFFKKAKFKKHICLFTTPRSQKWKLGNATGGKGSVLGIELPRSQVSHCWGKTKNPGTRLGIKLSIKTLSPRANYSKSRHKGRFTNRILRHRFAR